MHGRPRGGLPFPGARNEDPDVRRLGKPSGSNSFYRPETRVLDGVRPAISVPQVRRASRFASERTLGGEPKVTGSAGTLPDQGDGRAAAAFLAGGAGAKGSQGPVRAAPRVRPGDVLKYE